jgi:hypothetical protein
MDYETKIYLDNLIEAVEKLDSPDRWSIGITAVNALIMIWLGWKQYKLQQQHLRLQEQQTKQQDYQLYKTMFQVISDANIEISNFLFVLYIHISNAPKKDEVEILLQQTIDRIKKVDEAILQSATDLHLKFPKEKTLIQDYRYLIGGMFNICNNFNELYKSGGLVDTKLVNDSDDAMIRAFPNDNKLVSAILAHIKDVKAKQKEYSFLRGFVYHKEKLFRKDYLTKISDRCKTE